MNTKRAKEIRKFVKEKYPHLKETDPKAFKKLVKKIKNIYKATPRNERQQISIE